MFLMPVAILAAAPRTKEVPQQFDEPPLPLLIEDPLLIEERPSFLSSWRYGPSVEPSPSPHWEEVRVTENEARMIINDFFRPWTNMLWNRLLPSPSPIETQPLGFYSVVQGRL